MSSAEQPLIANSGDVDHGNDDFIDDGDAHPAPGKQADDSSPGLFIWLLAFSAGISGTSLSGRALSSLDKSIITSCTSLFALIISPFASILADTLGRKRVILVADALFIMGAVVQAWSSSVALMVVGRSIVGAAVGAASFVVPLYIAELAPAAHRGRLVTTTVVFITLGQVVAYIVGWLFGEYGSKETAWRWMVGLGALPAALQLCILFLMPETPRWLVKAGRSTAARDVIVKVLGHNAGSSRLVEATLKDIEIEVREEEQASRRRSGGARPSSVLPDSLQELLNVRRNRRALAIACLLQGLQQLCGFNSLMYFSATIFTLLGFPIPTLTSLVVAVTNFAFTLVALVYIDRVGRRRILLLSIPFMVLGLLLAAFGFSFIDLSSSAVDSPDSPEVPSGHGAAITILVSIMLYVAGYAIGLGNVPWMQSELFSLNVRSLGSGIATATNWGANFVIGLTFLLLMDALTPSWTFVLYAVICAVGYGLIWTFYPETAGLSLEEAATLLEDDNWGLR
ncbi:hypothetical protein OQA88_12362 [Cercophora sp. LCS_1]